LKAGAAFAFRCFRVAAFAIRAAGGLYTAATLWCPAAVGVLAGGGALPYAAIAAAMVIAVNLLLRPLVQRINRQPLNSAELPSAYVVNVVCKGIAKRMCAHCCCKDSVPAADRRADGVLKQIVGRLSLEPAVTAAGWRVETITE
jgi:putative Mg2+ transporter-C (MgtC) family protein